MHLNKQVDVLVARQTAASSGKLVVHSQSTVSRVKLPNAVDVSHCLRRHYVALYHHHHSVMLILALSVQSYDIHCKGSINMHSLHISDKDCFAGWQSMSSDGGIHGLQNHC